MEGFNDRVNIAMPFSAAYVGDYTDKVNYYTLHGLRPNFPLVESLSESVSYSNGFLAKDSAKANNESQPSMIGRAKLNQFAYICTLGAYRNQHGRVPKFNAEFASAVGGYPKGAILRCSVSLYGMCETVISMQDNNTVNPDTYEIGSDLNGKVWWKYVRMREHKSMPRLLPKCNTLTKLSGTTESKTVVGQRFAYSGFIEMTVIPTKVIGAGENIGQSDSSYGVNPQGTQVPLLSPCEITNGAGLSVNVQCIVSE